MSNYKSDTQILQDEGLDPDKWILVGQTLNHWGNETDPAQKYYQRKLHAVKKRPLEELVIPARSSGHQFKKPVPRVSKRDPELVAFVGDQHAPFYDKNLHRLFLCWLDQYQPDRIVLMGDGGDYTVISRHPNRPEWCATTQESIQSQYDIYRDIREHAPNAQIDCLVGNHEIRLATAVLSDLQDIYSLTKAVTKPGQKQEAVLSLSNLLRLDELEINLVEDDMSSTYENARIVVRDDLVARHGTKATTHAGKSAWKTLESLDHSLVQGHSHRQAVVSRTLYGASGPKTIYGVETGCMCDLSLGKAYTTDQDWQQGWATAQIYPDGQFQLELAQYRDKALHYRGIRWR